LLYQVKHRPFFPVGILIHFPNQWNDLLSFIPSTGYNTQTIMEHNLNKGDSSHSVENMRLTIY